MGLFGCLLPMYALSMRGKLGLTLDEKAVADLLNMP